MHRNTHTHINIHIHIYVNIYKYGEGETQIGVKWLILRNLLTQLWELASLKSTGQTGSLEIQVEADIILSTEYSGKATQAEIQRRFQWAVLRINPFFWKLQPFFYSLQLIG